MEDLYEKVLQYNRQLKETLQLVIDELNKGQKKKLLKNETNKKLLERYKINYD